VWVCGKDADIQAGEEEAQEAFWGLSADANGAR
jgi:hypothetical protein